MELYLFYAYLSMCGACLLDCELSIHVKLFVACIVVVCAIVAKFAFATQMLCCQIAHF